MKVINTTAKRKIESLTQRKRVIQGGTSASKTFSILCVLIKQACKKKTEISIVGETVPHLRRGAIRDFIKIMIAKGIFVPARWNKTLLTYQFANRSTIEFFSADQEARLRGARRQVLFINEANNIDFESYYQLAIRTSEAIYIDFNPTHEFWAHTEVLREADSEPLISMWAASGRW